MKTLFSLLIAVITSTTLARTPAEQYAALCASCHTPDPAALAASPFVTGSDATRIDAVIRQGRPARGMPAFGALPEGETRDLALWLKSPARTAASAPTMLGRRIEAENLRVDRSAGFGIAEEGQGTEKIRYLQWIDRGSHLCYEDLDLTGVRSIEYRFAKGDGEPPRRFALVAFRGEFAGGERIPLGEKITPLTGGWTRFRTDRLGLARQIEGRYRLCIIGMGGGGVFNLDYFVLSDAPGTQDGITRTFQVTDTLFDGGGHRFRLEKAGDIDGELWSLDFLDERTIIATQKSGSLWLFRDGQRIGPVAGTPAVHFEGQGGLLHVRAHPDYRRNGWIYLTFTEPSGPDTMLTIVRGRHRDGKWLDQETIYRATRRFFSPSGAHFGGRLAFVGDYLFFGIGGRGTQDFAQDPANPFGKIHRIHHDGRVPADNPFVGVAGAVDTIWSLGHRNPQGITVDSRTHSVWATEHGPKGGDELNLIQRGRNYGWPRATHGVNYDGTPVSPHQQLEGMESPRAHWSPSPGLSNLVAYRGDAFPRWRGHLLVTSLAHQELKLMKLGADQVVGEERLFAGEGRLRDVVIGPDGMPYVALNQPNGQIYRLSPAGE
jgi:glucose/arabinose dehydrogenase